MPKAGVLVSKFLGLRLRTCSKIVTIMKPPVDPQPSFLPRQLFILAWTAIVFVIHGGLPWLLARLGPGWGWEAGRPQSWNWLGLAPLALGLGLFLWSLATHAAAYPQAVPGRFATPRLVVRGPYRWSRNPMYLAAVMAWSGWAIFYGSPAVVVGTLLMWLAFAWVVIPREEHALAEQYQAEYLMYCRATRRWLGKP
jgi:protein-S-isoprenylcysteine O-methyltransferase Ste14